jgi:hypothetical protein
VMRNCRSILCYIEVDVVGKMTTEQTTALYTFVSSSNTDPSFCLLTSNGCDIIKVYGTGEVHNGAIEEQYRRNHVSFHAYSILSVFTRFAKPFTPNEIQR